MLPRKWGTITKLGVCVCPRPQHQAVTEHMMQLGEYFVHRKSVKVKVNKLMYGQFSLATGLSSLLAYSNNESQAYSYIENC